MKPTEIEVEDLSESSDVTLRQVLGTLCLRHRVQDTFPRRPEPNLTCDIAMNNWMTNFLLLGKYLSDTDKQMYVLVLECMGIVESQGDWGLIEQVLGLSYQS